MILKFPFPGPFIGIQSNNVESLLNLSKILINSLASKFLMSLPLLITYLIGPIGLTLYWLIRVFYAKRINLYD